MADFSFLSDSDDDRAVEELLSKAMDDSILQQVAAINCSGFPSDSPLPSHLESRFRKLKSFPTTGQSKNSAHQFSHNQSFRPQLRSDGHKSEENSVDPASSEGSVVKLGNNLETVSSPASSGSKGSGSSVESEIFSSTKQGRDEKEKLKSKSRGSSFRSPLNSSNTSIFSPSKREPDEKIRSNSKSHRSFRSNLTSRSSSLSPPRKTGCFWCSPKGNSRKKIKENRSIERNWGKDGEFLSLQSTFSVKEQQKILKKAMKEEERIAREADKIVRWAKQASARMEVFGLEDELSDNEITK